MSLKLRKQDQRLGKFPSGKLSCPVTCSLNKNLPHQLQSLILAVSGGVDSMVLLHAAIALAKDRKIDLYVAHVDHGLRKTSSVDASFVCISAQKEKLPFYLFEAKKSAISKYRRVGQKYPVQFFFDLN